MMNFRACLPIFALLCALCVSCASQTEKLRGSIADPQCPLFALDGSGPADISGLKIEPMQNTITKAMTDEASVMRLRQSIFNYYNGTRTDYPARSATLSFKNGTICDADGNMARVSGCIQMNGGAKPGAKELSRIRGGGMKMVGNRIVRGAQADYVLEFMDFDYAVYRLPEAATTPAPETPKGK